MFKYEIEVKGMRCPHCEAHTNDAIRNNFKVKKVTSDRTKNLTTIIAEEDLDIEKVKATITGLGYEVGAANKEPYKKKFLGLF